ncbi:MAG: GNAT family N-acetyltransferase [Prosthecobacter sp.]|uniref:GNAT family N-acetyltransferase n=1 Tax=Prosthecobacter sp. TaxID=1965333 RepID=UPI0026304679|nr:GNAT family N-acetyltransferase [Prosthecobacter sp.]MCF7790092.1 GNAT family N-acetyltransferase [Prosthecobacter sp.]
MTLQKPDFIIEPLNPAIHRRDEFDCGVPALNDFLRTRARKEMDAGTSACFVIVPESDQGMIAGYYTLSAATVVRTTLPEALTKKLPRYEEFPATLLGRLARDIRFKGQQIGERLMASMLRRAVAASQQVASWAVITDPKDEKARQFYVSFGFQSLTSDRLFLPMKQAASWVNAR